MTVVEAPSVFPSARVLAGEAAPDLVLSKGRPRAARAASTSEAALVAADGALALVPAHLPAPFAGLAVERTSPSGVAFAPATFAPARLDGNAFVPVADGAAFALARWSLAEGRAFTAGPESERWILVVGGDGLAFLENGDTLPIEAGDLLVAPAGHPVRVWGRHAMQGVVVQPQGPPVARRTLAAELARLRDARRS